MSPEQARGDRADRRSDIWALECMVYECLDKDRRRRLRDAGELRIVIDVLLLRG